MGADALYVAMTRGRHANHIHLAPPAFEPDQHHGPLRWRYAHEPGVGADDTANITTLTDGRHVETRAKLLADLTEWHNNNNNDTPTVNELNHARRILSN